MTCHVAMVGAQGAVMFSDSQGSTSSSEAHGWQKQVGGKGFLVGAAGAGLLIEALFRALDEGIDKNVVEASNVEDFILSFLATEVVASARKELGLLLAKPSEVKTLNPGLLTKFFRGFPSLATIGSGAEFVQRAASRNHKLGIAHGTETLADTFVSIEAFIDAANESLTVDDQFTIGILRGERPYLLAHQAIFGSHVPQNLRKVWGHVGGQYEVILALVRTMTSEAAEARRQLQAIRRGELRQAHVDAIAKNNESIGNNRRALQEKLADYLEWYDKTLGRPPAPRLEPIPR